MTMRGRTRLMWPDAALVPAMLALLLAASCGTGTGSRSEEASVDPCTLVTAAEARQVLAADVEVERPAEVNNDYLATCRYVGTQDGHVAVLAVTVSRRNGREGYGSARRMKEVGVAMEPVPGVGDDAVWAGDPLNTLYLLRNERYLSIRGDIDAAQARALGAQAVARLP